MSIGIPDLWPEAVQLTDVVSPLVILRHQAGLLRGRTNNILDAEVKSHSGEEGFGHVFQFVVPALGRKTYTLFEVRHAADLVYPVTVMFEPIKIFDFNGYSWPSANDQTEFTQLLARVFGHPKTVGVIHSLLAQANEQASTSN